MALIKLAHEVLAQARASIALPFDARSGAAGTGRRSRSCFPGRFKISMSFVCDSNQQRHNGGRNGTLS